MESLTSEVNPYSMATTLWPWLSPGLWFPLPSSVQWNVFLSHAKSPPGVYEDPFWLNTL
jgi:hypothetical protein